MSLLDGLKENLACESVDHFCDLSLDFEDDFYTALEAATDDRLACTNDEMLHYIGALRQLTQD